MNKYAKISEKFWLIVTLALTLWVIFEAYQTGTVNTFILLILPGLTLVMFLFRRMLRKRFEKNGHK